MNMGRKVAIVTSHQPADSVMLAKPDAVGGRHHHATGPLRSSRWGAMKPTDQTNHSRNIRADCRNPCLSLEPTAGGPGAMIRTCGWPSAR